jgi:hypothetical protein
MVQRDKNPDTDDVLGHRRPAPSDDTDGHGFVRKF